MKDFADALQIVLQNTSTLSPEVTPITSSSLGQVLAISVTSDLDSPPFDKALMDGYAIRSADAAQAGATLKVIEEVIAGKTPQNAVDAGQATRIMTGAMLPAGADCVVPHEKTTLAGEQVTLQGVAHAEDHILRRGREMRAGESILHPGDILGPQEFGILATVGKTVVTAYPCPRVAILSTGDELVEPMMKPMEGQIRNSNGTMLVAQSVRAGALPRYLGIARDDEAVLTSLVKEGLATADVLVLSGGVSAGKRDLVPEVLEKLRVQVHFHKVNLKPGRPFLFGTHQRKLIFGLPGNPVSSFVCFELLIRPALRKLRGHTQPALPFVPLPVARDFQTDNNRPTFGPGRLRMSEHGLQLEPLDWFGSADLRALVGADALWSAPAGQHTWQQGDLVPVLILQ